MTRGPEARGGEDAVKRTMTRRSAGRIILGAPLAAASAGSIAAMLGVGAARADEPVAAEPDPTPLSKFLARQDGSLDSDQRAQVRKDVTRMEQALQAIRDFKLSNDVPPAGTFRALRSKRG